MNKCPLDTGVNESSLEFSSDIPCQPSLSGTWANDDRPSATGSRLVWQERQFSISLGLLSPLSTTTKPCRPCHHAIIRLFPHMRFLFSLALSLPPSQDSVLHVLLCIDERRSEKTQGDRDSSGKTKKLRLRHGIDGVAQIHTSVQLLLIRSRVQHTDYSVSPKISTLPNDKHPRQQ